MRSIDVATDVVVGCGREECNTRHHSRNGTASYSPLSWVSVFRGLCQIGMTGIPTNPLTSQLVECGSIESDLLGHHCLASIIILLWQGSALDCN